MKIRMLRLGLVLVIDAISAVCLPSVTFAHHSFAMFDTQKSITVEGTVKEFQWTNPHIWVQLLVKDKSGKTIEWAIEGGSPNSLGRQGWKRTSLKPGDKATVVIHPMKDGSSGGLLMEALVNGRKVGN